jgi:outer membrane receptor protein involved in Fe transport
LTIPLLYHFGGLKSTYISDGLQSVDFYPGGFGTRYGGGTAGVIEIKSRAPKTDRLHGVVDMSTLDGSLMLEGPVNDKVSIFASARKSFLGEILTQFYENTDVDLPITAAPYYWDYTVRADMDLGDREKLFINLFGARDSLGVHFPRFRGGSDEVDEATDQISSMIQFHRATLGHDMAFNDKWENSLRTAIARVWSNNSVLGMIKAENSAIGAALRNELAYKHSDKLRMNIGIDAELSLLDLLLVIPGQGNVLMRDTSDDWLFGVIGGYANVEYKPIDNLTIIPGLRYDFYSELDYYGPWLPEFWDYSFENTTRFAGEPSLRLTSRYTVTEGHTVKGALGNYSQSPEPQGQVIHPTWGDPTLPATRAAHYVLGYEWQITDLIHADIQGYLNRQWSIPRMANDSDLVETGNPDQLWLSDGRGRMHGLEFMLRHDQGERFFGWIAYTLSRSERFDKHEDEWALYGNDETHHLQLVGSWRLPHSFETGFRLRYVTGKPTTPVIGRVDNELYNFYEPIYGETNSERVDPFFQLDLRVDKKFIFQNWILSSYLDLQNISWLLYKSPEYEMYDNFYDEKTTVSNVLTPAIGLRAEF